MNRRHLTLAVALAVLAVLAVMAGLRLAERSLGGSREQLERQLTARLGRPVHIGRVALGWRAGLGIDLENVTVEDAAELGSDPLLRAGSVGLTVALWPLITDRELTFDVVVRHPVIRLVRSPHGVWNYAGLGASAAAGASPRPSGTATPAAPPAAATPPPAASTTAPAALPVVLREARIVDGTAEILDAAAHPPTSRRVTQVDLTVHDVGTLTPTRFSVAAAIDAPARNVAVDGTAGPFFDPSRIPIAATGRVGPVGPQGLLLDDVRVAVAVTPDVFEIDSLDGTTLGGTLHASGRVPRDQTAPIALTTTFAAIDLARLVPLVDPTLAGRLSGAADGTADLRFRADSLRALRTTVQGTAELHVRDAVLHRFNVVTVVVDGVSDVPGLGSLISHRTRAKYARLFDATQTCVSRVDAAVRLADQRVMVDRLMVTAPEFSLQASGTVGFDMMATLSGVLSLSAPVSTDIVADVKLAGLLRNESGEFSLPWKLRGRLGQAVPQPETAAIARLVGRGTASEVVAPLLHGLDQAGPIGQALKRLFPR